MASRPVILARAIALALVATAACGAITACGGPRTAIVVRIDSEIPLSAVHARVGDAGCEGCDHDFALDGEGAVSLPFSFVIAPRGGDASRAVSLLVEGRDALGAVVVTRTVRTRFREGRTILLNIVLEGTCRMHGCATGTTCVAGDCVDDTIDPATLPEIEPGQELELDAGAPHDGGGDAGAPGDAGDAGSTLPRDCVDVRDRGMTEVGLYTIDPDGEGVQEDFVAMCDPVSDGGGWTLIANVLPRSATLGFDGEAWEGMESLANPAPSTALGAENEGLFLPYWRLPVDALRVVMIEPTSGTSRTLLAALEGPATTLRAAMTSATATTLGPTTTEWAALADVTDVSTFGDCAITQLGARMSAARVRIGVVVGEPSMTMACGPTVVASAWFGVGAAQEMPSGSCTTPTSPPTTSGGATVCGIPSPQQRSWGRQGLVWGRSGG